ncbi:MULTISPECIES: CBS and ACT domain-containing protein [Vagococcus]|uniref:Acetoin utilization protein, truncated n=1 Tax=Vagococcus fluvialis bH819 TaxID=1255619 RepID=A0A1X6WRZ4_9ENTE|nr:MULTISPECIES: CBS and ACT domain-containing protein [Vagococcus]SLM86416.1 acetoin utilization protein, truncated [Vagococcus fluvialis bH819]HCM89071.1 CBS domain-containing protein [Vagococcus sp.]
MLVKDYMSKNLVTISKGTKIFDAIELMNQKNIHRIPVTENNAIIGLITEGTIQEAMPSKATSLSVYEANYLLNKTIVEDVMINEVEVILEDCLLEDAIFQMRQYKINVLPVLNASHELVGIITNNDIFDAFLNITGYKEPGTRIAIKIEKDHEGVLADLTQIFANNNLNIIQIVVYRKEKRPIIVIQTTSEESKKIKNILKNAGYHVISAIQTKKR